MGMCKPSGGKFDVYGPYRSNIPDIWSKKPNIRVDYYDEKTGKLLQQRWYGPDGWTIWDIDWDHGNSNNNHIFPHDHYWDFTKPPGKQRIEYKDPNNENNFVNNDYC